jgi:UDP-glucose 4-epimerase
MIVVIGASSSTGVYLIDELMDRKRDVFATSRSKYNGQFYSDKGFGYARLDVTRKEDFEQLPKGDIEAVILLAGLLPANLREYDPTFYREYIEVNITGTVNVLEYCRRTKARKIIFASSHSDVAGLWDSSRAITEEDPRTINYKGDHAVYIISKITAMDLIEHYHQEYGVQGISFRLPAVYGYHPRTGMYIGNRFVKAGFNIFVEKAMKGEPIEIWGNPHMGKDIVYVKDVAGAFIRAVDSTTAHGLYNIATGVCTTLEQEVKDIIEVFSPPGRRSTISYNPNKPDTLSYLYDIRKAQRDLGYRVEYPFRKMLEDYKAEMQRIPPRFPELSMGAR